MKKSAAIFSTLFLVLLFTGATAQKISVKSGSFDDLKGQETVNIEYTFDNMGVGKFDKEEDYIAKKVAEYNGKEPGTGDKWQEAWVNDRDERFRPRFEEEFDNMMMSKGVGMRVSSASDYTLIVHTSFTEPGFNIGITRANAYVNLEVYLVKTGEPGNVLAEMIVKNAPGRDWAGYDFDTGFRIQEAYAKAGKEIAYYIWKSYLK